MYLFERKFKAKERLKAANSGVAMQDGSFPIYNKKDLKNAIKLSGHSKHGKSAAMAHIRKRAKILGISMTESIKQLDEAITSLVIRLYEEDSPEKSPEEIAHDKKVRLFSILMHGTFKKPIQQRVLSQEDVATMFTKPKETEKKAGIPPTT